MQTGPKTNNYSGLIAVLGLITLIGSFVIMILLPDIKFAAWSILALGVILLAMAFILSFRQISGAMAGKRGRFSTGTTVMASIFIGIIIIANAISISNFKRFDLSRLSQFTLTDQTKDILTKLQDPVDVLCFFSPSDIAGVNSYASSLLSEYEVYTNKLTISTIDPDAHPEQARQYGVTEYSTIVFESQNRRRAVAPADISSGAEYAFTSAILEVTGTVQKKVYFLIGHDEHDINSTASGGYSSAKGGLLNDLYRVDTFSFVNSPNIPEDCAVLIIAAPQKPFSSAEIAAIWGYLGSGGQALILTDPIRSIAVDEIVAPWQLTIDTGTVIDPSSNVAPDKSTPSVTADRDVFGLPIVYFPGATSITIPAQQPQTMQIMSLLDTTKDSWLSMNYDPKKEPTFNVGTDIIGPLHIGAILAANPTDTTKGTLTRIIVIGDSDFASNAHFENGNNGDLFLDAVNWLAQETQVASIRPKVLPYRRLVVDQATTNFIDYSSIALLPLLVLIAGGIVWWRRR
jgi:ABC-type uncharacterized transport system involved in gliding motility auxiliary subunit